MAASTDRAGLNACGSGPMWPRPFDLDRIVRPRWVVRSTERSRPTACAAGPFGLDLTPAFSSLSRPETATGCMGSDASSIVLAGRVADSAKNRPASTENIIITFPDATALATTATMIHIALTMNLIPGRSFAHTILSNLPFLNSC
jgi:hypothetical protein